MILNTKTSNGSYDIVIKRGALGELNKYLNLDRKVLIVTDSGVPEAYLKTVAKQCRAPFIFTFPQGEESNSFDTYKQIL